MNSSLLIWLLVIAAILIVGYILLRRPAKRHHAYHPKHFLRRKEHILRKKVGHGVEAVKQYGRERSPEWARVAKMHRLKEPVCVACGYKGRKLQVHHIKPFHLHPNLELDPKNLITLCEARGREHHLLLGHLDAWDSFNEHIREDVKHFYHKSAAEIRADIHWQKKVLQRP